MNTANLKILVNSASRISSSVSSSNFKIQFPNNIYLQERRYIRLAYVGMYNTFYNVNSTNNFINFRVGVTVYTTSVAPGIYNANTLASALQTAMTAQIANTWAIAYNSTTKLYTISGTSAFQLLFSTGSNANVSLWKVLGFASSNGLTGIDTTSATSTTSTQVVQINEPLFVYITLNNISSDQTFTSDGDSFSFVIPVDTQGGELIEINANESFDQYIKVPDNLCFINSLQITLSGRNAQALSLNGSEWIMILEFYKK